MAALYRKYRSKSLADVVGQEHITDTLALAIKNGKVNHAYLFTGPRGVGKTSVARILAHAVNDLPYDEGSQHLDVIEIDAASNRRIDDIRDLREKVHIAPVSARYKVYIVDEVHMLTGESFNALLKTLEEPPAHVIFILATTEVHKLPATIISRAQRYHFRPIHPDKAVAHLRTIAKQEGIKIDDDALRLVAERGDGSFRDSISLLDQLGSMTNAKIDRSFVESAIGIAPQVAIDGLFDAVRLGDTNGILRLVGDLQAQGVSAATVSEQLIRRIMQEHAEAPNRTSLLDELLEVPKNLQPSVKLAVALLKATKPHGVSVLKGSQKKQAAAVATPATEIKKVAPKELTKAVVEPQPHQITKTTAAALKSDGAAFTADDWPKVLQAIQKTNPPVFSVLNKAAIDCSPSTLTLTFSFKLHQKKMDDPKYKTKLTSAITALGFTCPDVVTAFGKVEPTSFVIEPEPPAAADETAASVLAMMGGGESVNAEG